MLKEFENWLSRNRGQLSQNYEVTFRKSPENISKRSAYMELVSASLIARVTLWDTGECDEEALSIESEEGVFYERTILNSVDDLNDELESFLQRVGLAEAQLQADLTKMKTLPGVDPGQPSGSGEH